MQDDNVSNEGRLTLVVVWKNEREGGLKRRGRVEKRRVEKGKVEERKEENKIQKDMVKNNNLEQNNTNITPWTCNTPRATATNPLASSEGCLAI